MLAQSDERAHPFRAWRRRAIPFGWPRTRRGAATWPRCTLAPGRSALAGSPTHAQHAQAELGMPKGLYARALIIIIAPIVVLEGVVAFVFMERHWQAVTRRLSEATARDIAALIDIYEEYPSKDEYSQLIEMARDRLNCRCRSCRRAICPRRGRSRSSRCSTARCRTRSAARCSGRSGSTPSASRATWKSASSRRTPSCASSPRARRPTPRTRTSSCCG